MLLGLVDLMNSHLISSDEYSDGENPSQMVLLKKEKKKNPTKTVSGGLCLDLLPADFFQTWFR